MILPGNCLIICDRPSNIRCVLLEFSQFPSQNRKSERCKTIGNRLRYGIRVEPVNIASRFLKRNSADRRCTAGAYPKVIVLSAVKILVIFKLFPNAPFVQKCASEGGKKRVFSLSSIRVNIAPCNFCCPVKAFDILYDGTVVR